MADTENSRSKGRIPMAYIDFTSTKMLPTRLPPAAICAGAGSTLIAFSPDA